MVLRAQRLRVGSKLGQRGPLSHGGGALGETQRDALAPRLRGNGLERDQPDVRPRIEADAAARSHRHDRGLGARDLDWLVRIARKLRDCAERTQAPLCLGILDLAGEKIEKLRNL